MEAFGADDSIEAPDAVSAYTNSTNPQLNNWRKCRRYRPVYLNRLRRFQFRDLHRQSQLLGRTCAGTQNKLPYISTLKMLIIPSNPTAEAAMRVGKIGRLRFHADFRRFEHDEN